MRSPTERGDCNDLDAPPNHHPGIHHEPFGFATSGPAGDWKTTQGSVPYGSNTFVGKAQDGERIKKELQQALNERLTNGNRNKVFFTGGIVWAMVSLEEPEKQDMALVPVSYDLIQRF